jgi:glucosamine-phosphate N-acetyltransferase
MDNIQINDDLIIRNLEENDFLNYLNLMKEFTNYNYNISYEEFTNNLLFLIKNKLCFITVIFSETKNKIIGAGSIFKLIKLHNNPIGQIEDVIINNEYRGLGYGKRIIDCLIQFALKNFNCYKIILNCLDKNVNFYKKCNFILVGNEMKYNNIINSI